MNCDDYNRVIGRVISVTADRFVVEMNASIDNFTVVGFDAMHYVARLGSFLMIPLRSEYVVVEIVGLRERDVSTSSRQEEFNQIGSLKYLDVVPVGMLPMDDSKSTFRFGISVFPPLYADVIYALDRELDRIFETNIDQTPDQKKETCYWVLPIGKSSVFENYDVKVRLNDFFSGHVAILGNTGSGKSCTIASILQSLFRKPDEYHARGATFIVFDVNGEYRKALEGLEKGNNIGVKHCKLDGTKGFRLPHWYLDLAEWELLLQASERTQLPVLRTALGLADLFHKKTEDNQDQEIKKIKNHIIATCVKECWCGVNGDSPVSKLQRIDSILKNHPIDGFDINNYKPNFKYGNFEGGQEKNFLRDVSDYTGKDIHIPSYNHEPFPFNKLNEYIDFAILYEEAHGNRQIRDYCSAMITRLKSLQEREEYAFLRHKEEGNCKSEKDFLIEITGLEKSEKGLVKREQIIIIDLNSVEDEIVELVSAVITRMLFRLLRQQQGEARNRFPIHVLLEEAHRYISSTPFRYTMDANKIFERIAKEGRKYSMFIILASQRPSELSKTVLSQCSNFLVHRIQNPDDLFQIRQMTPFISEAVLKRLPSLPRQHALVFGTSVNLPTTFKIREANPTPHSDDTKVVDLWFCERDKSVSLNILDEDTTCNKEENYKKS